MTAIITSFSNMNELYKVETQINGVKTVKFYNLWVEEMYGFEVAMKAHFDVQFVNSNLTPKEAILEFKDFLNDEIMGNSRDKWGFKMNLKRELLRHHFYYKKELETKNDN